MFINNKDLCKLEYHQEDLLHKVRNLVKKEMGLKKVGDFDILLYELMYKSER